MAIYHLTLKKDVRPDGSRVSPVSHTDYINRDKRYKDYDEKDKLVSRTTSRPLIRQMPVAANTRSFTRLPMETSTTRQRACRSKDALL